MAGENAWGDPRSEGMGLLYLAQAINPRNRMLGGLLNYSGAVGAAQDADLKRGLLQAQIAETTAQGKEREQKMKLAIDAQARQDKFLNGDPGGVSPVASSPSVGGVNTAMPQGAAPQGGGLLAYARSLGMPEQVIQADVAFNGGKKISEFINSRSSPKWENINGHLVNTNAQGFQGGFQPGMNASSDGRVTAWQPDGQGGLVVGAPRGALDTYRAYQGVGEKVKADFDPVTVTPQNQPPQMTTRGALVSNPQVNGSRISSQQQKALDSDRPMILQGELNQAQGRLAQAMRSGDQSAAARAQADIAGLQRELGGSRPTVGMPLQSEEEKLRAVEGVKGDTARNAAVAGQVEKSSDLMRQIGRAKTLLGMGPTASGVGAVVDKALSIPGISTRGAETAAALDNVSGWLTSNVPRMEGPQSNYDVENYKVMAGRVGDRTLPVKQRLAALEELEAMQKKYEKFGGQAAPSASNAPAPPKPMKGMIRGGYRFKGGDPSEPSSWEKQ